MTLGFLSFCLSVCFACVTGRNENVEITTNPEGANVVIYDRSGKIIDEIITPDKIKLKRAFKPYKSARYTLLITADGCRPTTVKLKAKINPFCYTNLLVAVWILYNSFLGSPINYFDSISGFIPVIIIIPPYVGTFWRLTPKNIHIDMLGRGGTHIQPGTPGIIVDFFKN